MSDNDERRNCDFEICQDCKQSCCQDAKPPLTRQRKQIVEEYSKKNGGVEGSIFTFSSYTFPSVDSDEFCIFYDKETKLCQIHEVKPETCRSGPVTFDVNWLTSKIEWFLKTRELCPFAGKLFDSPERLEAHLKIAKEEIIRLISELEYPGLKAILAREEPQTFKIGEDPLPKTVLSKFKIE